MKLPCFLRKMQLSRRILFGYVVMIFIPIIVLASVFYQSVYQNVMYDYAASKQQLLTNSCTSLEINLTQIERIYESLQYNQSLLEYLSDHFSDKDAVYTLLKYIRPVLSNLSLSSRYIDSIHIYKANAAPVSMPPEIQNLSALQGGDSLMRSLGFNGQWIVQDDGDGKVSLAYQKALFSEKYTRQIGLLCVTAGTTLVSDFLKNIQSIMQGNEVLMVHDGQVLYQSGDIFSKLSIEDRSVFEQCSLSEQNRLLYLPVSQSYANEVYVTRLGLKLILLPDNQDISSELSARSVRFFALVIALLALVSGFFVYIGKSITSRITNLLKHIQTVGKNSMAPFEDQSIFEDEISMLALNFNQMLHRIKELINTANRTELLRKEAEYSSLQAQIQPHFFYNTMEAIRLMAEDHGDVDTADACYAFSCLMRYSLSNKQDVITLQDELNNAVNYLRMYKLRMGYKFEYHIHVEIEPRSIKCPKYILQPLLENSIVHGISKSHPTGHITLVIKRDTSGLVITIRDNGVGMSDERLHQVQEALQHANAQDCFGLANVNDRVRAFFGGNSGLTYESKEGQYTLCTLRLCVDHRDVHGKA